MCHAVKGLARVSAWNITIYREDGTPEAEVAQALRIEGEARTGIAWGADATWADSYDDGIEHDIECWLNDPDEWGARN